MKRYEEYKDSGIEWIGEIPKSWTIKKVNWIFSEIGSGTTPNRNKIDYYDGEIPWLNTGDLTDGFITKTANFVNNRAIQECSALKLFKSNSIVIAMYGATIGKLGITQFELCTNQACCVLGNPYSCDNIYLFYSFFAIRPYLLILAYGGGQPNISQGLIKELKLCVPDLPIQHAIADYLDRKTANIDALIADKKKLVELLQEKRTAVISEAVTKGLDKTAKMKDSGIEWIGEIPTEWEIVRVKQIAEVQYGLGQPPETHDDGLPLIRATNIFRGKVDEKDMIYVYPEDVPPLRNAFLKEGDILVVRSGAYTGDSAIITKKYEGAVAGYDMVLRAKKIAPEFLAICLLSKYVLQDQLALFMLRAAQPHLNAEELRNTYICLPNSKVQRTIISYVNRVANDIDSLISDINEQIKKLKEYRQAVISEVVTGKVAV